MRRLTILLFAVLLALAGVASPELLAPPAFGDPTRMRAKAYANAFELQSAFFGDGNATNFTLLCWMRWTPRANYPAEASWACPFVMVSVSADPAQATKEGGPELENLCSHRYEVPLTLSGGTWAATCLPATYDYPPSCSDWQYGCYCVNVETDAALTVNVGGAERNVAASNGVRQVFNIKAETASRAVSISAASNSARVKFGIAENPLVQFIGAQFDSQGAQHMGTGSPSLGGIASDEWRLVVARGLIATNCLTVSVCGFNATSQLDAQETCTQALWHPRATFAKHARIRLSVASLMGLSLDGQDDTITLYGYRVYRGWMSEADILRMRDLDVAEMTRRGM